MHYTPKIISFQHSSHITYLFNNSLMEIIVDPDQLASEKPADLDLHCF